MNHTCPEAISARVTADAWRRLCLDLENRLDRTRADLEHAEQTISRLRRHQPLWQQWGDDDRETT